MSAIGRITSENKHAVQAISHILKSGAEPVKEVIKVMSKLSAAGLVTYKEDGSILDHRLESVNTTNLESFMMENNTCFSIPMLSGRRYSVNNSTERKIASEHPTLTNMRVKNFISGADRLYVCDVDILQVNAGNSSTVGAHRRDSYSMSIVRFGFSTGYAVVVDAKRTRDSIPISSDFTDHLTVDGHTFAQRTSFRPVDEEQSIQADLTVKHETIRGRKYLSLTFTRNYENALDDVLVSARDFYGLVDDGFIIYISDNQKQMITDKFGEAVLKFGFLRGITRSEAEADGVRPVSDGSF